MICYKVNDRTFNNVYLALHHAWTNSSEVQLYCKDFEYDQFDWTQEPESSLDDLMAAHAHSLRDGYDRLILLWSGGTDSHTIYNIFKRENIHIDEIMIKASRHSAGFPEKNYEWIAQNHWDPTTIITRYDDHDSELRALDIPDEHWIWRDKGDLLKYGMTSSGDGVRFLCDKNHAGTRYCAVAGYEKPRLIYRQGRWFARQLDMTLRPTMGHDYIHHFFLDPLINIKQNHLVKHAVKKIIQNRKLCLWDDDWAESKWDRDVVGYRDWATACGRHDELYVGVSNTQKHYNDALDRTEISTVGDWRQLNRTADHRLAHDLSQGNTVALNYVKGMHSLYSESGLVHWLRQNQYFRHSDQCVTSLKFIWSKEYDLGT
jgi:hypothetical protein